MKNNEIKEKARSLLTFIAVDLVFVTVIQIALQSILQTFIENHLVLVSICVALCIIIVALSWLVYTFVIKKKKTDKKEQKMILSNREKILKLQAELLQDFFEIQMKEAFTSWQSEVQSAVSAKQNSPYSTYKEMKKLFDTKPISDITVKDFDVTALSALMRFDFISECCINLNTKNIIGHIALDRNSFSHISNYNDKQHIFGIERIALNHIADFLNHLRNENWTYSQKDIFFRKYLGTGNGDGRLTKAEQEIAIEQNQEIRRRANLQHYLQGLQLVREERARQYVPLSYNLEWHNEKMLLDELIETNICRSGKGFKIVAEGGYGKSWTLSEIAGQFAMAYLDKDEQDTDAPIPILIELGNLYDDCNSVSKKIAQLLFNNDESQVDAFLRNNNILLLLDAMDEAKIELQSDISREIASYYKGLYPRITFICAARKSCIDRYPESIPCYRIQQFDDEQIELFFDGAIDEKIKNREQLLQKAEDDWVGENRKSFLYNNRTPFYISCYLELLVENGDVDFADTTQLIDKFLTAVIDREIKKTGFCSDRSTFISFLIELCRLMDSISANGDVCLSLPENDVVRELTQRITIEQGYAPVKTVGRKLVEMQILSLDENGILLSFAHQNYKDFINRKYLRKKYF